MPENYESSFWEEIWGCVNYIKLPYETVMSMPVLNRKIWIQRYNLEQERLNGVRNGSEKSIGGESINTYAKMEQNRLKNNVL